MKTQIKTLIIPNTLMIIFFLNSCGGGGGLGSSSSTPPSPSDVDSNCGGSLPNFSSDQKTVSLSSRDFFNSTITQASPAGRISVYNACPVDMVVQFRANQVAGTTFDASHANHFIMVKKNTESIVRWDIINNDPTTPIGHTPSSVSDPTLANDLSQISSFWMSALYCPGETNPVNLITSLNQNDANAAQSASTYKKNNCLYLGGAYPQPPFDTKFELSKNNELKTTYDISTVDGFSVPMAVLPYVSTDETYSNCGIASTSAVPIPPVLYALGPVPYDSAQFSALCNYNLNTRMSYNFYIKDKVRRCYLNSQNNLLTLDPALSQMTYVAYNNLYQNGDYSSKPKDDNDRMIGCYAPQTRLIMNNDDPAANQLSNWAKEDVALKNLGGQATEYYDSRTMQLVCPYSACAITNLYKCLDGHDCLDNFRPEKFTSPNDVSMGKFPLQQIIETYIAQNNKGLDPASPHYIDINKLKNATRLTASSAGEDTTCKFDQTSWYVDNKSFVNDMCRKGAMGQSNSPWPRIIHDNTLNLYSYSYDDEKGTLVCKDKAARFKVILCGDDPK